jgi:phospholipid-binding lipoprotein MlaA
LILKPVSLSYSYLPNPLERGISNALRNIGEPINFTNYIFQGDIESSFNALARFVINSTIGLFGLFDVANKMGLKKNYTDFGYTLEIWGVPEGDFLVLPFFGPRTTRHLVGNVLDLATNPLNYYLQDEYILVRSSPTLLYALSSRSSNMETIDNLRETSIDYYSSLKSIYTQNRKSFIINTDDDINEMGDFFDSFNEIED